ncbi:unnamed protein product [Kuraishia capsulata CBS 1993]|uniref:Uncharacterized protein n=1 Tax=Kuraishia capsulata CBS 1993 TaxID=1382522 RepID=W6MVQ9_9ASCO|nr:uncharacterized protein KUCA_T00002402001 [Kuraishia capsulata CBS 1993]CDK26430.1 unnamed protein product [Kuraishia capsulata CBS 1993]
MERRRGKDRKEARGSHKKPEDERRRKNKEQKDILSSHRLRVLQNVPNVTVNHLFIQRSEESPAEFI